jgi:hypothetical protein
LDGNNIYRSDGEYLKVARIFPEKPLTVADYAQKVSKGQEMDGAYSPNKAYRIEQDKTGAPVLKLIYGTSELQNLPVINLSTPKYIDDQEEVGQVIAFNKKP